MGYLYKPRFKRPDGTQYEGPSGRRNITSTGDPSAGAPTL